MTDYWKFFGSTRLLVLESFRSFDTEAEGEEGIGTVLWLRFLTIFKTKLHLFFFGVVVVAIAS